jgi:PAS domain-containing protein
MDVLTRLPAVVVLDRIPVPSLAMARNGTILFANAAFAEMVGYQQDRLAGLAFPKSSTPCRLRWPCFSGVDALANLVVRWRHCEGWTVRARMRKSALRRRDDPIVLVTFDDLTARLWVDEH